MSCSPAVTPSHTHSLITQTNALPQPRRQHQVGIGISFGMTAKGDVFITGVVLPLSFTPLPLFLHTTSCNTHRWRHMCPRIYASLFAHTHHRLSLPPCKNAHRDGSKRASQVLWTHPSRRSAHRWYPRTPHPTHILGPQTLHPAPGVFAG